MYVKYLLLASLLYLNSQRLSAQILLNLSPEMPKVGYENIHISRIVGDSNYTAFIIWIKQEVKPHYHATHTEVITVLEGKAMMTLNDSTFRIKKGSVMVIPENSVHSVKTLGKKPLKVISIQTPWFDGKDRIMKES